MRAYKLSFAGFLLCWCVGANAGTYPFEILRQKDGVTTKVIVQNNGFAPVVGKVSMGFTSNARSDAQWPLDFKLPPRSQVQLATIYPVDPAKTVFFDLTPSFSVGDPSARIDTAYRYRLPFKPGTVFDVLEDGETHSRRHATPYLKHGYDFGVPTGKIITAARSGVVIRSADSNLSASNEDHPLLGKNGYNGNGYDYSANTVAVLHDDGSIATYAHLLNDGLVVKEGDRVEAGQVIALVGKSIGHASNYVHFAVLRQTGSEFVSLPIRFFDDRGALRLKKGDRVRQGGANIPTAIGKAKESVPVNAPATPVNTNQATPFTPKTPSDLVSFEWLSNGVIRQFPSLQGLGQTLTEVATPIPGWAWLVGLTGFVVVARKKVNRRQSGEQDCHTVTWPEEPGVAKQRGQHAHERPSAEEEGFQTITEEVLERMEWKRLELVVAEYFRMIGYEAITQDNGADGGVDVTLKVDGQVEGYVQCKHHSNPVGVEDVCSFIGRAAVRELVSSRGEIHFYAKKGFSVDAKKEGKAAGLIMVDGSGFLRQIEELGPTKQKRLAEIATEGDWETPTCASCGGKMTDKGRKWQCPQCGPKSVIGKPRRKSFGAGKHRQ